MNRNRNVDFLSIAMDVQGPDKVIPYVEKANAEFITVVDESNLMGELYKFNAIPNGYLIDENGVIRYKKLSGFDIRIRETSDLIEKWITGPNLDESLSEAEKDIGEEHSTANRLFRDGLRMYRQGRIDETLTCWRKAIELEPDNFIIRKQIWAVQNPEKFYDGDIDYKWQNVQMENCR